MKCKENSIQQAIPWYRRYSFRQYSAIIIVLVALIVIGAILSYESFFNGVNFTNIIRQASILGIVAIGMTFVIIVGGIDLSAGSNLVLSSVTAAIIMTQTGNDALAVIGALVVGLIYGLANGLLIIRFNIAPFIVTLAMSQIGMGIAMFITNSKLISAYDDFFSWLGEGYAFNFLPIPALIFIVAVIIGIIVEKKTVVGRYMYAIGGNEEATKLSGINVPKFKLIIYSFAGLLIGVAAVVQLARMGAASSEIGKGAEMDAIAAVVIGGTSIAGGVGSVIGSAIGILILKIMDNILNMMNVPSFSQMLFKGIILLVAIIIYQKQQKKH